MAAMDRAAQEMAFVSYSLACTDYVAIPAIKSHNTEWKTQQVKTKKGTVTIRTLSMKLAGALGIFKREGSTFNQVAMLEASVPGLADYASDTAGEAVASLPDPKIAGVSLSSLVSKATAAPDLPSYISAVPDLGCLAGKAPKEGVSALVSCGPKGQGTVEQALGNLDERLGPVCREAVQTADPTKMAECEVRARAFQLSRALQKQARSVDGWRLFGVVKVGNDGPSIPLGRDEGVRVGYAFEALDGSGERAGFFKVTHAGAGGDVGETDRSRLNTRSGDVADGARVQEYPQAGLVVTVQPSVGFLALNSSPTTFTSGAQQAQRGPPAIVFGGGAMVGYDLSSPLHWSESYLRIGFGVLYGSAAQDAQALLVPIDLWFEKGVYLGRRVTFTSALGLTYQYTSVTVSALSPTFTQDLQFTGNLFGPAARFGLSLMLHPDWSLNVEAAGRFPVNAVAYGATDSNGTAVPAELQQRSDHFASVVGNLALAWTY